MQSRIEWFKGLKATQRRRTAAGRSARTRPGSGTSARRIRSASRAAPGAARHGVRTVGGALENEKETHPRPAGGIRSCGGSGSPDDSGRAAKPVVHCLVPGRCHFLRQARHLFSITSRSGRQFINPAQNLEKRQACRFLESRRCEAAAARASRRHQPEPPGFSPLEPSRGLQAGGSTVPSRGCDSWIPPSRGATRSAMRAQSGEPKPRSWPECRLSGRRPSDPFSGRNHRREQSNPPRPCPVRLAGTDCGAGGFHVRIVDTSVRGCRPDGPSFRDPRGGRAKPAASWSRSRLATVTYCAEAVTGSFERSDATAGKFLPGQAVWCVTPPCVQILSGEMRPSRQRKSTSRRSEASCAAEGRVFSKLPTRQMPMPCSL